MLYPAELCEPVYPLELYARQNLHGWRSGYPQPLTIDLWQITAKRPASDFRLRRHTVNHRCLAFRVRRAPNLSVTLHPFGEDGLGIHRVSHIPLGCCLEFYRWSSSPTLSIYATFPRVID